jgi:hypothetical protein
MFKEYKASGYEQIRKGRANKLKRSLIKYIHNKGKVGGNPTLYRGTATGRFSIAKHRVINSSVSSWTNNPRVALRFSQTIANNGVIPGIVMKIPSTLLVKYIKMANVLNNFNDEGEYLLAPSIFNLGNMKALPNGTIIANVKKVHFKKR